MTMVAGHSWQDWKHAMRRWAHYHGITVPSSFDPSTPRCADACQQLLGEIHAHAGIRLETGLGPKTQRLLHPLLPGPTPLERFIAELQWGINNEAQIHYAFDVATPLQRWAKHDLPISTNCTRSVTSAAYAAGLVDPNGLDYKQDGFTGDWLQHLHHIPRSEARRGDLAVFGTGEGDHGVAIMRVLPGQDFDVFSHGWEGGPQYLPLSVEARYHVGQPVTFLHYPMTER